MKSLSFLLFEGFSNSYKADVAHTHRIIMSLVEFDEQKVLKLAVGANIDRYKIQAAHHRSILSQCKENSLQFRRKGRSHKTQKAANKVVAS